MIWCTKSMVADDHGYDGNYMNSIIGLTDSEEELVIPIIGFVLDG